MDIKGHIIEEKEEVDFSTTITMVQDFNLHHITQVLEFLELPNHFNSGGTRNLQRWSQKIVLENRIFGHNSSVADGIEIKYFFARVNLETYWGQEILMHPFGSASVFQ